MMRPLLLSLLAALAAIAVLLGSTAAWAKYVPPPPPAPDTHCVTTVGWLSKADIKKIDEESEIAKTQTGFIIDVLLAPSEEPIDEVAAETFKAWKPGDPVKDNGILLVIQPNFPRGERKARMQVGTGVQSKLTAAKGTDILRNVIGPLINNSDQIRTGIAAGVMEIAKALGATPVAVHFDDGVSDASASSAPASSAGVVHVAAVPAPTEGLGMLWVVLGGALAVALGYLAFRRLGKKS